MTHEEWEAIHGYPICEAAQCGYCLYLSNLSAFMTGENTGDGSECPECGFPDESVPRLDEVEIAELLGQPERPDDAPK